MGANLPQIVALAIFATLSAVAWNTQLTSMYFVPQDQVNKQANNQVHHKPPLPVVVTKVTSQNQQSNICNETSQVLFVSDNSVSDISVGSSTMEFDNYDIETLSTNKVIHDSEVVVEQIINKALLCSCVEVGCLRCPKNTGVSYSSGQNDFNKKLWEILM
jgi:hypothetical protein